MITADIFVVWNIISALTSRIEVATFIIEPAKVDGLSREKESWSTTFSDRIRRCYDFSKTANKNNALVFSVDELVGPRVESNALGLFIGLDDVLGNLVEFVDFVGARFGTAGA